MPEETYSTYAGLKRPQIVIASDSVAEDGIMGWLSSTIPNEVVGLPRVIDPLSSGDPVEEFKARTKLAELTRAETIRWPDDAEPINVPHWALLPAEDGRVLHLDAKEQNGVLVTSCVVTVD